jgi:hypothetical protein
VASIASLLPAGPDSEQVRVIAAGRPHPPVPGDVPPGHPLTRCRVRPLATSPKAQANEAAARWEIGQVLSGPSDVRDLVGLIAAAGGGLTAEDLQSLTGLAPYEIEGILHTAAGRTVTRGAYGGTLAPDRDGSVYLLAHDTLQQEAIRALGAELVARYRSRIVSWAGGYRARGWPPDTPVFLLRGYPDLLRKMADDKAVAECALDVARHARLREHTGGDAAALTEIQAAQGVLSTAPTPDLLLLARLLLAREDIARSNSALPSDLPGIWASLGQPSRAEALARGITDPDWQAEALTGVARALVAAGQFPEAERIARAITDPDRQAAALTAVARALVAAGEPAEAERIVRAFTDPYSQAAALTAVAGGLVEAGQPERGGAVAAEAERIARAIATPVRRAAALTAVARGLVEAGQPGRGGAVAAEAEQIARTITDPYWQARALTQVARALAAAGQLPEAERLARAITDPYRQAEALTTVAGALVEAGQPTIALQLIAVVMAKGSWTSVPVLGRLDPPLLKEIAHCLL